MTHRPALTARTEDTETRGLGAALQRARPDEMDHDKDRAALNADRALHALFAPVTRLLHTPTEPQEAVEERLLEITRHLARRRAQLMAVLYRPQALVQALAHHHDDLNPRQRWIVACWSAEAAWRCTTNPPPAEAANALTDHERAVLLPVAARQRFLAFSRAYRTPADTAPGPAAAADRVFGHDSAHVFVAHSIEARRTWATILDHHESHPALGAATAQDLDEEIDLLLFDTGKPGALLGLSQERLQARARTHTAEHWAADDRRLAYDIAQRHLLPRYQLRAVTHVAAAMADHPKPGRCFTAPVVLMTGLATALLVATAAVWPQVGPLIALDWAAGAAGVCYVLGATGVVFHGRMWALPWLLRMPAAAAIGLFMLTAMHPSWWHAAFDNAWLVRVGALEAPGPSPALPPGPIAALLAGAAYAYLMVTARNNGLAPALAAGRAALVWGVGLGHALMVALIGLVGVIPVFSENGALLHQGWHHDTVAGLTTLIQASSWCLAAGVFSQILWDDRPITAPLTHARWHEEI